MLWLVLLLLFVDASISLPVVYRRMWIAREIREAAAGEDFWWNRHIATYAAYPSTGRSMYRISPPGEKARFTPLTFCILLGIRASYSAPHWIMPSRYPDRWHGLVSNDFMNAAFSDVRFVSFETRSETNWERLCAALRNAPALWQVRWAPYAELSPHEVDTFVRHLNDLPALTSLSLNPRATPFRSAEGFGSLKSRTIRELKIRNAELSLPTAKALTRLPALEEFSFDLSQPWDVEQLIKDVSLKRPVLDVERMDKEGFWVLFLGPLYAEPEGGQE